jgi:hypothetical protein
MLPIEYVDKFRVAPLDTSMMPVTEVMFAPRVVVFDPIFKLLKLVNTVFGRVLLAVNKTEPVPGVHVLVPVPATAIVPFTVNTPPLAMFIVEALVLEVFPIVSEPQVKVDDEALKLIVPFALLALVPLTVTAPITVMVLLALIVNIPAPELVVPPSLKVLHVAVPSVTVTVKPPLIITSSFMVGTVPVFQVEVEFQFPVPLEVIVAAPAFHCIKNSNPVNNRKNRADAQCI